MAAKSGVSTDPLVEIGRRRELRSTSAYRAVRAVRNAFSALPRALHNFVDGYIHALPQSKFAIVCERALNSDNPLRCAKAVTRIARRATRDPAIANYLRPILDQWVSRPKAPGGVWRLAALAELSGGNPIYVGAIVASLPHFEGQRRAHTGLLALLGISLRGNLGATLVPHVEDIAIELKDVDSTVRSHAAMVLAYIPDPSRTIPGLYAALECEKNRKTRATIEFMLGIAAGLEQFDLRSPDFAVEPNVAQCVACGKENAFLHKVCGRCYCRACYPPTIYLIELLKRSPRKGELPADLEAWFSGHVSYPTYCSVEFLNGFVHCHSCKKPTPCFQWEWNCFPLTMYTFCVLCRGLTSKID